jgi:acetylornithine/succinyldiaminopimelate/putrescine aminotransferase
MLCAEWDGVRPDITVLGKALSGGTMPVAAVLADDEVCMRLFGVGGRGRGRRRGRTSVDTARG